jgi:hypothetical protein
MVLDTPERRRLLLNIVWENAVNRADQDESRGLPPDALEVWENFHQILGELGVEIVLQPIGEGVGAGISMDDLVAATTGRPLRPVES